MRGRKITTTIYSRTDHLLAHIYVADDDGAMWIQESLIEKGFARTAA
jgi:hypothetical protein